MKAHKVTLIVADCNDYGINGLLHCFKHTGSDAVVRVHEVVTSSELGEWDDDNPLNGSDEEAAAETDRLFPEDCEDAACEACAECVRVLKIERDQIRDERTELDETVTRLSDVINQRDAEIRELKKQGPVSPALGGADGCGTRADNDRIVNAKDAGIYDPTGKLVLTVSGFDPKTKR